MEFDEELPEPVSNITGTDSPNLNTPRSAVINPPNPSAEIAELDNVITPPLLGSVTIESLEPANDDHNMIKSLLKKKAKSKKAAPSLLPSTDPTMIFPAATPVADTQQAGHSRISSEPTHDLNFAGPTASAVSVISTTKKRQRDEEVVAATSIVESTSAFRASPSVSTSSAKKIKAKSKAKRKISGNEIDDIFGGL